MKSLKEPKKGQVWLLERDDLVATFEILKNESYGFKAFCKNTYWKSSCLWYHFIAGNSYYLILDFHKQRRHSWRLIK